jgi:dienelactone hydrolase
MAEVDHAAAGLRAQGARHIVVIGHSLGANGAIGYARRHPVFAVVAIAPGHLPETSEMRARTAEAIAEAKALIASGHGDERRMFPDLVQGIPTITSATPRAYVSMFAPDGPAVIPANAAAMPRTPLLWVVGTLDPIYARGRNYAFTRGAKHPKSRYLEVTAFHLNTAGAARDQVIQWLKSL